VKYCKQPHRTKEEATTTYHITHMFVSWPSESKVCNQKWASPSARSCGGFPPPVKTELELELIQSHMAQKPVLRGEVWCAYVALEVGVERGGMGESKKIYN